MPTHGQMWILKWPGAKTGILQLEKLPQSFQGSFLHFQHPGTRALGMGLNHVDLQKHYLALWVNMKMYSCLRNIFFFLNLFLLMCYNYM